MVNTSVRVFEQTLRLTNEWLDELAGALGTEDRHRAYQALRATLHALRDRITVDEAAHLGAQLPLLVRGIYYEGWHPAGKPLKERSRAEFLEHIQRDAPDLDAEAVARAVFALLGRRVAAGEIEDVWLMLPGEVRTLWRGA